MKIEDSILIGIRDEKNQIKTPNKSIGKVVFLSSWMGRIICPLQALCGHVSVDLGRRETGMPEQGLDATEIGPVIEQMGGKGMP